MNAKINKIYKRQSVQGVCGGIADFFGISPLIVRIIFLFTPGSLLIYILLAYTLPENQSLY
ncbi:PspC domain-containing protein [Lederbergia wuyishanensis]|uniref:Phage shock protein PspC (Stress-responsive transcriptional regulator) n=1 Tax=Lederbergia wuyishanensis TaxID=1347903 RepID=A0ABU0D486_9BACI|nr:PspC domain-containing protein [Lederbergia wuyishanensis]MDQ0343205.1 phage shock protein PspC (stress-responsive transcriptional regulator) [Lederbergia wuyishanensis]